MHKRRHSRRAQPLLNITFRYIRYIHDAVLQLVCTIEGNLCTNNHRFQLTGLPPTSSSNKIVLEAGGIGRRLAFNVLIEPRQMTQQVVSHMLWLGQAMSLSWVAHEDAGNVELPQRDEVFLRLWDWNVHILYTQQQKRHHPAQDQTMGRSLLVNPAWARDANATLNIVVLLPLYYNHLYKCVQ